MTTRQDDLLAYAELHTSAGCTRRFSPGALTKGVPDPEKIVAAAKDPSSPHAWVRDRWNWISRGGLGELVSSALALLEESKAAVVARCAADLATVVRLPKALTVERCRIAVEVAEREMLGPDGSAMLDEARGMMCEECDKRPPTRTVRDGEQVARLCDECAEEAAADVAFAVREELAEGLDTISLEVARWASENEEEITIALDSAGEEFEDKDLTAAAAEFRSLIERWSVASCKFLAAVAAEEGQS